ncbi:PD-(D/E)XK motif protein [Nocardioides speluncae]|uniref:PD-(D/E)XK motif protein n=1 Tax=Nocardioides speluncae TaxID=2670337 RepID=UPI000D69A17B|nr:PD-(D/E)XK motif protein [Nocardioides speluncae]
MTPDEFVEIWESLATPTTNQELEAREVVPDSGVWIARDNAEHQHLLVLVDGRSDLGLDETHGLSAAIIRHRIAGRTDAAYVDLLCLDPGTVQTFATVAADIATVVIDEPIELRTASVTAAVREWRWFWGVDPDRMSVAGAVGLFGELWFLNRWAGHSAASVQAWEGSNGSRHDFQWPTSSVEVKTTALGGAITHTIEHLEQLDDPVTGHLYLYSLRIARDSLAANSLSSLATSAINAFRDDPVTRADLKAKLARRGYTPAGRNESEVTYRVVDEGLYRVTDDFPRLTQATFPDGLPHGVAGLTYQLDMNACGAWRTGSTPDRWSPDD